MGKIKNRQLRKLFVVAAAVCMMGILQGVAAKAATSCTPTDNDRAFVLSRIESGKSSREGTKHWVKIFTTTEEKKRMYDITTIPDNTSKIAVKFKISNYDLDSSGGGVYWGYQMSGDNGKTYESWQDTTPVLNLTGNGEYTMVFDAEKLIGDTVSSRGMQQLQIVIPLAGDSATAATKQTAIEVQEVLCYTKDDPELATVENTSTITDAGNTGTGDTGTGGTGSTGTGDAGTGGAGVTGTGDTGTGGAGSTGTGDAGTGSTGGTGTGDAGIGGTGDTGAGDAETEDDTESAKKIKTLKLTSYKKGAKKITGKTIKKAKVTVKLAYGSKKTKTYTIKSDKKGNFTVKLAKALEKNTKITVTVKKNGYKTRKQTYKVK